MRLIYKKHRGKWEVYLKMTYPSEFPRRVEGVWELEIQSGKWMERNETGELPLEWLTGQLISVKVRGKSRRCFLLSQGWQMDGRGSSCFSWSMPAIIVLSRGKVPAPPLQWAAALLLNEKDVQRTETAGVAASARKELVRVVSSWGIGYQKASYGYRLPFPFLCSSRRCKQYL